MKGRYFKEAEQQPKRPSNDESYDNNTSLKTINYYGEIGQSNQVKYEVHRM